MERMCLSKYNTSAAVRLFLTSGCSCSSLILGTFAGSRRNAKLKLDSQGKVYRRRWFSNRWPIVPCAGDSEPLFIGSFRDRKTAEQWERSWGEKLRSISFREFANERTEVEPQENSIHGDSTRPIDKQREENGRKWTTGKRSLFDRGYVIPRLSPTSIKFWMALSYQEYDGSTKSPCHSAIMHWHKSVFSIP